jgi:transposase
MVGEGLPGGLSELDRQVFEQLVPRKHYLRRALERIDWDRLGGLVAGYYSPDRGRPSEVPVRMLKLEFLRYHDNLSDRQVIARAETDVAYRFFLGVSVREKLPDPSSLCYFRGRLGVDGFRCVFRDLVSQAREHGLVKDRLRIKDATHVIAGVALPTTLALVAQVRDKLLGAAEPLAACRVAGERANVEVLRESSAGRSVEERLAARVAHLREILAWADELSPPAGAETNRLWKKFLDLRGLAHKILSDQEHPKGGKRTRSTVDPDVRRGKHGGWYDGYLFDVLIDADSEVITEINVLPACDNEGADAVELVQQEEAAQGNDVAALSIDGAGFQGAVLRQLEDPAGLAVDVYVPPKQTAKQGYFAPQDFAEDRAHEVVRCPAGEESRYRDRDGKHSVTIYRFRRQTCAACPLRQQCLEKTPGAFGRSVRKSDYEPEHHRAREKATTPEYQAVRREHPKVERKLGEVMNRHGGRRARYRGRWKVLVQELMASTAANVKRMVQLLCAPKAAAAQGT